MKHGNEKHGFYGTPSYRSWDQMKQRCLNLKCHAYPEYGGRGVALCKRWYEFQKLPGRYGAAPTRYFP